MSRSLGACTATPSLGKCPTEYGRDIRNKPCNSSCTAAISDGPAGRSIGQHKDTGDREWRIALLLRDFYHFYRMKNISKGLKNCFQETLSRYCSCCLCICRQLVGLFILVDQQHFFNKFCRCYACRPKPNLWLPPQLVSRRRDQYVRVWQVSFTCVCI